MVSNYMLILTERPAATLPMFSYSQWKRELLGWVNMMRRMLLVMFLTVTVTS